MVAKPHKIVVGVAILFGVLSIFLSLSMLSADQPGPPNPPCWGGWKPAVCAACPGMAPCCCVIECTYGHGYVECVYACWC